MEVVVLYIEGFMIVLGLFISIESYNIQHLNLPKAVEYEFERDSSLICKDCGTDTIWVKHEFPTHHSGNLIKMCALCGKETLINACTGW